MRRRLDQTRFGAGLPGIIIAVALVAFATVSLAADPVEVAVTIDGDPVPGGTVTASAAVAIHDGSTLQSIEWRQGAGGPRAILSNTKTDTLTVLLPDRKTFRTALIRTLEEQPVSSAVLEPHVPPPAHYRGGLQDRFTVVGISPLAREHAGAIHLEMQVVTTSGEYHFEAEIVTHLPWPTAIGTRNVPVGLPVLLHGKAQASWNWTLVKPPGSAAGLVEATSQDPEFTPDVPGRYEVVVTDQAAGENVTLTMWAGRWEGIIVGQDADGLPRVDPACTACHVPTTPHFDLFTPWKQSGHAQIFAQNVTTLNGHYGSNCVSCHTVGYDPTVANGGFDDQPDFAAFMQTDLLTHGGLENWTEILDRFPQTARLANIQCENCHGPQDSDAHMKKDGSRKTQSSDLCGSCHGEPARHGRYQQWQLSRHGNYELAEEEGTNPTCAKCHSSNGFIAWANKGFSTANLNVTWTTDEVHPVTCVACHDPHYVGTTSGGPATNATVRISGSTPALMAGFTATNVGRGAICMTCHNARRGLKNDATFNGSDLSRAPHVGPQADVLMGQNMYFTAVGTPGNHAMIEDSCVTCHMESTPPPASLSYNYGGTNHTFYAKAEICAKCHTSITLESVQGPVEAKMEALKHEIETALVGIMKAQVRVGNSIDLGGQYTVRTANEIAAVELIESHGRQGATVRLADGATVSNLAMNVIRVVRPAGSPVEIYAVADPSLAKAGWNYFMAHSDKSRGVHNPAFVNSALDVSLFATRAMNAASTAPAPGNRPGIAGGLGDGAGAVSCSTPFVYWAEIAAHADGAAGSKWRTDLVARNLASTSASLRFILHLATGDVEGTGTIDATSQKAFEDVVLALGAPGAKGSLEICSDQPLLVLGRIFNESPIGTFGQNFDGHIANLGYTAGETISLIGLRQRTGAFRSNISVTNGGATDAEVAVALYDAGGNKLTTYNLMLAPGQVVQDVEPFASRAQAPDLDWGFATVTVIRGTNVRASGSMIDMKTNDPTTVPAKQ